MRKAIHTIATRALCLLFACCVACSKQTAPGDHALIRYRLPDAIEDSYTETSYAGWDASAGTAFFSTDNTSFERMFFSMKQLYDTGNYNVHSIQQLSWSQSDKFTPQTVNGYVHVIGRTPGLCKAAFSIELRDTLSPTPLRSISGEFTIVHQP